MAVTLSNLAARAEGRARRRENRFGLTHVDHTAASAHRPDEAAHFCMQLPGAALHVMHGFSEEEARRCSKRCGCGSARTASRSRARGGT